MMQAWVSRLAVIDRVNGLPALPTIIDIINRVAATSSKAYFTQIQNEHIRVIAAAACRITGHKAEIIQH
jgi:hypothetical protein